MDEPEKAKASEPLDQDITGAPEMFERPSITDDQAREAYQSGNTERFNEWWMQHQERAKDDPTRMSYFYLDIRMANIEAASGQQEQAATRFKQTYDNVSQELGALRAQPADPDKQAEMARLKKLGQLETTKEGIKIRYRQVTGQELPDDEG